MFIQIEAFFTIWYAVRVNLFIKTEAIGVVINLSTLDKYVLYKQKSKRETGLCERSNVNGYA